MQSFKQKRNAFRWKCLQIIVWHCKRSQLISITRCGSCGFRAECMQSTLQFVWEIWKIQNELWDYRVAEIAELHLSLGSTAVTVKWKGSFCLQVLRGIIFRNTDVRHWDCCCIIPTKKSKRPKLQSTLPRNFGLFLWLISGIFIHESTAFININAHYIVKTY